MTIKQFQDIILLATAKWLDWSVYDGNQISYAVRQQTPSLYNQGSSSQYVVALLPHYVRGEYTSGGAELRVYDDGYVELCNQNGVAFRHANPMKVAALVAEFLTPIEKSDE